MVPALAVLTAVPFGVFGALVATWMRDLSNDVYFRWLWSLWWAWRPKTPS